MRKGDLGPGLACVRLLGQFTKNSQDAVQPIPSFLRPTLAEYVRALSEADFLWPGGWEQDGQGGWVEAGWIAGKEAGEFLRKDAANCSPGIVIGRKGQEANGGRVLDFHSFRHSYVSSLARAGIPEGLAQKLARASCRAILLRYTHTELSQLTEAIEGIPPLELKGETPRGPAGANGGP